MGTGVSGVASEGEAKEAVGVCRGVRGSRKRCCNASAEDVLPAADEAEAEVGAEEGVAGAAVELEAEAVEAEAEAGEGSAAPPLPVLLEACGPLAPAAPPPPAAPTPPAVAVAAPAEAEAAAVAVAGVSASSMYCT